MHKRGCQPNVFTYNVLIKTYKSAGMRKKSEAQLARMRLEGIEPDIVSYNTVLDAYCSAGLIEDAQRVLRDNSSSLIPNKRTYSILLKGYARASPIVPSKALDLLTHMQNAGLSPDIVVLNTVCDVCCSGGHVNEAISVLRKFPSIPPNIKTYSILLKGYTRMAVPQPERVLELLRYMEMEGCRPDIVTFNTVMKSLSDANRVSDCSQLFQRMKLTRNAYPDKNTYSILVVLFCRLCMFREAISIILEAHSVGYSFDIVTFMPLISSCKSDDDLQRILYIVSYILPYCNIELTAELLQTILKSVASIHHAKSIVNAFEAKGVSASSTIVNLLLSLCIEGGDLAGAIDLFYQSASSNNSGSIFAFNQYKINAHSFTIIIEGCCNGEGEMKDKSGSVLLPCKEAMKFLHQMIHSNVMPSVSLCNTVMKACSEAGDFGNVESVFQYLKENGNAMIRPNEASMEIYLCSKLKMMFRCLHQSPSSLERHESKSVMYDIVSLEHKVLEVMEFTGIEVPLSEVYCILITMLCDQGDLYLAYELFSSKLNLGQLVPTLNLLHSLIR
jgi:pentatricopeptide repeat protein